MNHKGMAAAWWFLIIIFIALAAYGTYRLQHNQSLLSINNPCMDWTPIPNTPPCTTTDACIPSGVTPDASISIRCNAGACELKTTSCGKVLQ